MTEGVRLSEEQFYALELWVFAAIEAERAASAWPMLALRAYNRRREEAKALLVGPDRATHPKDPHHAD